jgi:hypothetical protein
MIDYSIFYKDYITDIKSIDSLGVWDIFISAFNKSDRVKDVFEQVSSSKKLWIIHPEYNFPQDDLPKEEVFNFSIDKSEAENVINLFESSSINIQEIKEKNLCIDCTGMMRQELMYLIKHLNDNNIKKFDILYSEPKHYHDSEDTKFTKKTGDVKPIDGFSLGTKISRENNDLLIIGAGFDHEIISKVANTKKSVKNKVHIVGFPSLSADMYQQNILRSSKAEGSLSQGIKNIYFAPASDPFITASTIQEIVSKHPTVQNIFLSPLSTKAQTIGFALYYIYECSQKELGVSIIMPETILYSEKTSDGICKIWRYTIELPENMS